MQVYDVMVRHLYKLQSDHPEMRYLFRIAEVYHEAD